MQCYHLNNVRTCVVYTLCFSRVFLAGAVSILWIASFASMADTVGSANMGKTMGIVGPIVGSGAFLAPIVAGVLLSSVGYWKTWSVPVAMIALDLILRLAMTERPKAAECVVTNADMKTKCPSQAERNEAPAANDCAQGLFSTDTTKCSTEQCKWLSIPQVRGLSISTDVKLSDHTPPQNRCHNAPPPGLRYS